MFILRRKGGISAKELAVLCNARCRKNINRAKWNDFIVNYGEKSDKAHLNRNVNFDKIEVHKILEENGILLPKIYDKNEDMPDKTFPLLARKNFHSKGRDIIYLKNKDDLNKINPNRYDYLIEYIKKTSEYRVHILKGFTTIVNVKVNGEDDRNEIVRNRNKGWKQVEYNGEFRNKLVKIGEEVVDILDYDFAAIDIIRDKDNQFYVLEVNSAPGLEERKLKIYADYFLKEESKWFSKNRIKETVVPKQKSDVYIPTQGKWSYQIN